MSLQIFHFGSIYFSPMTSHTLKVKWVVSSLVHLPSVSVSPRTILKLRRIERFSPTISFYYQSTFMENPYMFHIYSLVYKAHLYIIIYVMFESSFLQSRERRTLHNYLQDNCSWSWHSQPSLGAGCDSPACIPSGHPTACKLFASN